MDSRVTLHLKASDRLNMDRSNYLFVGFSGKVYFILTYRLLNNYLSYICIPLMSRYWDGLRAIDVTRDSVFTQSWFLLM